MSLQKEKMANVDTAWWHMEEPTNLMMITAIMEIEGELDYPRLKKTVEQRLLKFDRFRQRVVDRIRRLAQCIGNWTPILTWMPIFDASACPHPAAKKSWKSWSAT